MKKKDFKINLMFNKEQNIKKIILILGYIYIYYNLMYLLWKVFLKIYYVGLNFSYVCLVFVYFLIFISMILYKKNEAYVLIFYFLLLQIFI